jgi:NAD kinase
MNTPRVVVVSRKTDYQLLLEEHATEGQARFFLQTRDQSLDAVKVRHERFLHDRARLAGAIPPSWRRASVERADLHRFLFEPDDIVVALGQDGLVANLAKYLDGQPVIGVNPEPERYDGILVPCAVAEIQALLRGARTVHCEERTMVEVRLDDGQRLVALNEIFVGHRSHQSARYRIELGGAEENQSSSGVIVTTGTGATGWARSICRNRATPVTLPDPPERRLAFFVREAFPSIATGVTLTDGCLAEGQALGITSRMNAGGVVFGDGIESDHLAFDWGVRATITVAAQSLRLVQPLAEQPRAVRTRGAVDMHVHA